MKQRQLWSLALLSILMLVLLPCLAVADGSAQLELGATISSIEDNAARVNEFTKNGTTDSDDDGLAAGVKLDVESVNGNSAFSMKTDFVDGNDLNVDVSADAGRILRLDISHDSFQHWKDKETLSQMGATARDDIGGSQPSVTTDAIMAEIIEEGETAVGGGSLTYDPAETYAQELSNDYLITRKETKAEADLTIPSLPNITFHAGMRIETRQGMEQAIGLQKCDSCHVSATGKDIDERTEDFTFGATGKFGLVTVEYEYLNRTFTEDAAAPTRYYEDATNGTAYNLLYEADTYEFARTPDSDKETHSIKARADFSANTNLTASYIKSEVESDKSEIDAEYELENGETLKTEYDSFAAKLATKIGGWRLSLRGSSQETQADSNELYFAAREDIAAYPGDTTDEWHTVTDETNTIGLDAAYRIASGTTLRLGYEYEEVDREEDELGDTETNSFKASIKSRINKNLSARLSYEYQDIDEPFAGALVGIAQEIGIEDPLDSGLWYLMTEPYVDSTGKTWYWTSVYPNRTLESSNQPEKVHEAKASATWAISPQMAATFSARVRSEENDNVNYTQDSYAPGVSLWYAPNNKLNLTMAYNFSKQDTENRACVGWYHG